MEKKIVKTRFTTNLWFDSEAEEAVKFYTSIFKNSNIGKVLHYTAEGFEYHHQPAGSVMTIEFSLDGQNFLALNGGPMFKFNEAISFIVNCDDQQEVDHFWNKLSEGGDPNAQQCGWLKDKFGLCWQIVPRILSDMLQSNDPKKVQNLMKVVLRSKKLDFPILEEAYGK